MQESGTGLRADILARLLLVQSTAGHLPDETSIIEFACRGLEMVPGVQMARNVDRADDGDTPSDAVERLPLRFGNSVFGEVWLTLGSRAAYAPYAPHVQNLLFVIGLMLEERRQRRLADAYQHDLEQRVAERTQQLSHEVEERRAAEALALAAMNRAEGYLAISEALIVELDATGTITVINKQACDVLGYSREQLMGSNWFDQAIPSAERDAARASFERAMAGATEVEEYCDCALVTRKGELKFIAWHNVVQTTADRITGVLSSGVDITERKCSEAALAAQKEHLDVTLRSIGDGVIATDTRGQILVMNPVAEQLTGWTATEAIGRRLEDVLTVVDARTSTRIEDPVARVLRAQGVVEQCDQILLEARDGIQRAISQTASPIRHHDGSAVGVILVFRDVTERNRLIEQTQRAERLDAIGILAGGIAHDFNNLLGGIFGYLCLAREHAAADSAQAGTLDEALQVFERARELTRQLLTFSKGGAPVRNTIDLRRLLIDCTRFALSGSAIASHVRLTPELPNVSADANQMWRVIDNLVRNAAQAMPRGGSLSITGNTVQLAASNRLQLAAGNYVRISVADNGPGIAPDVLPRIFDPFFTTKEQGSGLGLATAYSVVKRHEGHIEVESQLGVGTTFNIYLPVAAESVSSPRSVVTAASHRGSGRALVLDDEPYLCRLFEKFLTRMGYEVTVVNNGHDAILAVDAALVDGRPYRVALLDLTIPGGMGGKEAVSILRQKCPSLVTIAASGYSDDPIMAYPKQYGFDAGIAKPFAINELQALLTALVEPGSCD
jgi:PAS domain S-box-containing protein